MMVVRTDEGRCAAAKRRTLAMAVSRASRSPGPSAWAAVASSSRSSSSRPSGRPPPNRADASRTATAPRARTSARIARVASRTAGSGTAPRRKSASRAASVAASGDLRSRRRSRSSAVTAGSSRWAAPGSPTPRPSSGAAAGTTPRRRRRGVVPAAAPEDGRGVGDPGAAHREDPPVTAELRLRRLDLRSPDAATLAARDALFRRGAVPDPAVREATRAILADVRARGAVAVREASARFGGGRPDGRLLLDREELATAAQALGPGERDALETAIANVRRFAAAQRPSSVRTTIIPGVELERRWLPVTRVGAYVP